MTDLPEECTVDEAAEILEVDRRTVLRYMEAGEIRVRNVAPRTSIRKSWRLLKEDVLTKRTGYSLMPRPRPPQATRPVVVEPETTRRHLTRRPRKSG